MQILLQLDRRQLTIDQVHSGVARGGVAGWGPRAPPFEQQHFAD